MCTIFFYLRILSDGGSHENKDRSRCQPLTRTILYFELVVSDISKDCTASIFREYRLFLDCHISGASNLYMICAFNCHFSNILPIFTECNSTMVYAVPVILLLWLLLLVPPYKLECITLMLFSSSMICTIKILPFF
jgi:hypothetical protein